MTTMFKLEALQRKARDEKRLLVSPKTFREGLRKGRRLEGALVNGSLKINKDSKIRSLPEHIFISGHLVIDDVDEIELPESMEVYGKLQVKDCRNITYIPDTIKVGGDIYLGGCSSLKSLGNRKIVHDNLDIEGCTSLEKLPDGLKVEKSLLMRGFPLSILSNVADPGCIWCNLIDILELAYEDIPLFLNASFHPEVREDFHEILSWRLKKGV